MTLREIMAELEKYHKGLPVYLEYNHEKVPFGDVDSYRGYYSELAVDKGEYHEKRTVSEVIDLLESCVGKTFYGYKGGQFVMHEDTDLYFAEYGSTGPETHHIYEKYGVVYINCRDY